MSDITKLLREWRESVQLTNAFYSLYKQHRKRQDAYESQIKEAVTRKPLSEHDWKKLRDKVEKEL